MCYKCLFPSCADFIILLELRVKKALRFLGAVIICTFALVGIYQTFLHWRYASIRDFVQGKEASRTYDRDLLYLSPLGEPVVWVKPGNRVTLFFVDGFRGQAGAGIYREWFRELHDRHHINIVSPITGLQGWPFKERNREWNYREDMRQALQIYDAYTASLPSGHRVVLATQSFGALSNLTINAFAKRKPDSSVLISPLNTKLAYRFGGPLVQWLSSQTGWLRHIMPFMRRGENPARTRVWGIVNDRMSREIWDSMAKDVVNWEENLDQGEEVKAAAKYMEEELAPKVIGRSFLLIYGDDDLFFTREGFGGLAALLRKAGSIVDEVPLEKTGHMALFDNGGPQAKNMIVSLLRDTYRFKKRRVGERR